MRLNDAQEERLHELENKQNLNSMEETELQNLLDYYYDTGDFEEKIDKNSNK
jgi:hypothetical protein